MAVFLDKQEGESRNFGVNREFPKFKQFACKFISMFGTICANKHLPGWNTYLKSKYRANLSDDHLQSLIIIAVTDFNSNYKEILQKKSTVPSFPLKFA